MAKYVPDVVSRRWVIISPSRSVRPDETSKKSKKSKKHVCNFCPGNEKNTPDEVLRFGKGESGKPGWLVRVIPNKYPITDFHEVIINSPNHTLDIAKMQRKQVMLILKAYRERFNFYRKQGQVLIFCNHGVEAGASIDHPHSQLVVIPNQINLDTLTREPINNVVEENTYFTVYCPDFSQWPYEVWIVPKNDDRRFGDLTDEAIEDLSMVLQNILKQERRIFDYHKISYMPFGYNYYIYPGHSWYIRLIPRFIHRAGFELGTGLNVNVIDPTDAAFELRGVERRVVNVMKKLKKHGL